MNKPRKGIMRPVAWLAVWVMLILAELLMKLVNGIGAWIVDWVSEWSTIAIIAFGIVFGGVYVSLYLYSAIYAAFFVVFASDYLYPSKKGSRYLVFGIYEIVVCCLLILIFAIGPKFGVVVTGGPVFWLYARYVWLIIFNISMITTGVSHAK